MLLAAGRGTRLGALTRSTPKPLVTVGGVPMLERVASRLVAAGADRFIINTHHLADQVVDFVRSRNGFGVEVVFSHEPGMPLETGGAIRHAAELFDAREPFFLHNTDILTDLPLMEMYARHQQDAPLATLAVMHRQTSRYLLFDDRGLLGRIDEGKGLRIAVREPSGEERRLAFAGIHVIAPGFPGLLTEEGAFSILEPYLRLAGAGYRIAPFLADGCEWLDIGKPEQLAEADRVAERSML
ncbi:MAG: nucleotidyltransferase family protein [Gemmatimonadota bacterium]